MNRVRIKCNPYKNINLVSLNEKPMSMYSELSNYMKEPFLKWVGMFYESIDRELNDDYHLSVCAEPFETEVLKVLHKDVESCISFTAEPYEIAQPVSERIKKLLPLVKKYPTEVSMDAYKLPVYISEGMNIEHELFVPSKFEDSVVSIVSEADLKKGVFASLNSSKCVLCLSNESKLSVSGGLIWKLETQEKLNRVIELISERFVQVPYLIALVNELKKHFDIMTSEEQFIIQSALEIDAQVSVKEIPSIEVGTNAPVIIESNQENTHVRIVSLNPNVVQVEERTLRAVSVGKATIEFYRADELVPFLKKEVTTFQNNFIQDIRISIEHSVMAIGESQKLSVQYYPADAEDIDAVQWSVTDPNGCIELTKEGEIKAKKGGIAVIALKSTLKDASIQVEVLPEIEKITLSEYDVTLLVGQTAPIKISVEPKGCRDASCHWETSDKSVAVVETDEYGNEFIKATGIGGCTLNAISNSGKVSSKDCYVFVESSFKKNETITSSFNIFVITAVVLTFILRFQNNTLITLATSAITVLISIFSIIKFKRDVVWVIALVGLLLWIIR